MKLENRACRGTNAFTASIIFMVIFCFAGSAAVSGSCLSYGHSCWGAHGKRNDNNWGERNTQSIDNSGPARMNTPLSLNEHWLFSRLLDRKLHSPLSSKYRARIMELLYPRNNILSSEAENLSDGFIRADDLYKNRHGTLEETPDASQVFVLPGPLDFTNENARLTKMQAL